MENDMAMIERRKKDLERAGWTVGDTVDFLTLTPEEAQLVANRVRLSRAAEARVEVEPDDTRAEDRTPDP